MLKILRPASKGIVFILLVAGLLLWADRKNRNPEVRIKKRGTTIADEIPKAEKGRTYKLGIAYFAPEEAFDNLLRGMFSKLESFGYKKDSNLLVRMTHANAEIASIPAMLQNIDNQDVDIILASSTPVLTGACMAVKKKDVVFTFVYDPLAAGAGQSFDKHLNNVTGIGSFPPVDQTIAFINSMVPGLKRIGTIYNSSEANSRKVMKIGKEKLKAMGIDLIEMTVTNTNEVQQAAQVITSRGIEALWITGDNTALQAFDAIVKETDKAGIPFILNDFEYVERGATAAVGIGWYNTGEETAVLLARVLGGEEVSEIPFRNVSQQKIAVNDEKMKLLGIELTAAMKKMMTTEKAAKENKEIKSDGKLKIALAQYNEAPISELSKEGILDELSNYGLERGTDFSFDDFNAQGDIASLNTIMSRLAGDTYDMLFLTSTPTLQLAVKLISHYPVVFSVVADPIIAGAGKSFSNHKANITGISTMGDFEGMAMLVKEFLPKAKRLGTLYTPGEANSVSNMQSLKHFAEEQGFTLVSLPLNSATEATDAALSLCQQDIDAVCQIVDNLTSSCFASIIKAANKSQLPLFGFVSDQARQGAIAVVSRDYEQAGRDAVRLAAQILNGKEPNDIPFEFVSKTKLIVNKKSADKLNISIPQNIIRKADLIIEP